MDRGTKSISLNQLMYELKKDEYDILPHYKVTLGGFFKRCRNIFLRHCRRTLNDSSNLLDPFDRIIHKNGIALKGTWNITEDSPYSGYFKKGSQGLILVRASVAHTVTTPREFRCFGFVGKLFPTLDADEVCNPANFLTMDAVTGRDIRFFNDAVLTNETYIIFNWFFVKYMVFLAVVLICFLIVDKLPVFRPVDSIATLGEDPDQEIVTPHWLRIVPSSINSPSSDANDFREELTLDTQSHKSLRYQIHVAAKAAKLKSAKFEYLGYVELDESILSHSVDNRLHFHHTKVRQ